MALCKACDVPTDPFLMFGKMTLKMSRLERFLGARIAHTGSHSFQFVREYLTGRQNADTRATSGRHSALVARIRRYEIAITIETPSRRPPCSLTEAFTSGEVAIHNSLEFSNGERVLSRLNSEWWAYPDLNREMQV